jgi:hypothetical protein
VQQLQQQSQFSYPGDYEAEHSSVQRQLSLAKEQTTTRKRKATISAIGKGPQASGAPAQKRKLARGSEKEVHAEGDRNRAQSFEVVPFDKPVRPPS